jgi:two-component system response regulator YesN
MIVLVVDDQINVVDGIVFGVDWKKLNVSKVLRAYNAFEAKEILVSNIIDIILCDIEMPVENGISLLEWIRAKKIECEFIFLTSHPDFIYAKEALRLGSFDYILQPARYEDIEKCIQRAEAKIEEKNSLNRYSSYGKLLYDKHDRILQSISKEYLGGRKFEADRCIDDFNKFGIPIKNETEIYYVILQIVASPDKLKSWNDDVLTYGISNMVTEIFSRDGLGILLVQLEAFCYAFVVYPAENTKMDIHKIKEDTEQFCDLFSKYFMCETAVYTGNAIHIKDIPERFKDLYKLMSNNVNLSKGFFTLGEKTNKTGGIYDENMWNTIYSAGTPVEILKSSLQYLDELVDSKILDAQNLLRFYHDFIQLLSRVCIPIDVAISDIFEEDKTEIYQSGYKSIEDMKNLINFTIDYFKDFALTKQEAQLQVDKIVHYIRSNIEKDIHRSDIASAVYLSEGYISRLFRKEKNISLKEFITEEKINVARNLIRTTSLPISTIAMKVGYNNFSYFSQVYKKITGISPANERGKFERE